jgi:hypothetical protein
MAHSSNRVLVKAINRWMGGKRDELAIDRGDLIEVFGISEGGELDDVRLFGQIRYLDGNRYEMI